MVKDETGQILARLSIRARLWLLFATAIAVLALITTIALVNMARARSETRRSLELAEELTTTVNTARRAQVMFRKQVKEWKDLLLRGSEPGRFKDYWQRFGDAETEWKKGLADLEVQFPALGIDTAGIHEAEKAARQLGEKARLAIKDYDPARPESAFKVDKKARGLDHLGAQAIDKLVVEIEEQQKRETAEIRKEVDDELARAIAVSLASGAVLAVFLAAFSVLMIRSVVKPLHRTIAVFDSIRGGNLKTEVPADRRHEFGALWLSLESMQATLRKNTDELTAMNEQLVKNLAEIAALSEKSEKLLLNILPGPIAARLKESQETIADAYADATVLFGDLVGFTPFSQTVTATELVGILNRIFSRFDRLAGELGLEKIKTIGDCYMACAGLPLPRPDHAQVVAEMALGMQSEIASVSKELGRTLQMRIGINTGPVVAGVIGAKKFIYDLWGDAVNTASRMESHGAPGGVHLSESTYALIKDHFECLDRGTIHVKGKGLVHTYFLLGRKDRPDPALAAAAASAGAATASH